ncbi:DNA repair protein RecN (Recombination protein N) [Pilibacter termitis]|uniref:DNA repair protein RecN n=1 Tax=Pilibacter termitis TaxID=263852 RepID=A0A1T4NRH3_9ENTE|nr:DNA repair protein RecN [Pilibacter termitis]SJZ81849.1 DNA repair protein RecN (Recombination protein N) [Pilibacter termitis]
MLQELSIQDFAIISKLSLSFQTGMTVLTGETGAGKSIIIDAMSLLTGSRGGVDYIRAGANKAILEGQFDFPENKEPLLEVLEELGIECEEGVILIQRDLTSAGKNICRVNGRLVNLAGLRSIGEHLVDIHGQHEHQELMDEDKHLGLLDEFGGKKLAELKEHYALAYQKYTEKLNLYKKRRKSEKEFAQRVDMLTFQVSEIEEAELVRGEEEQLEEEVKLLSNYQSILTALAASYEALSSEEDSTLSRIHSAMDNMEKIEEYSDSFAQISETLTNSYYILQDVASELSQQLDFQEFDEERLNEVEERLDTIYQLKRKYGEDIDTILDYYEEISEELAQMSTSTGTLEELELEAKQLRKNAWAKGLLLREERIAQAKLLEKEILKELKELYMEKAQFEVRFTENEKLRLSPEGIEQVEFYITSNPGEPLKPLVKVASGGEMSRIMLALKTIFTRSKGKTSIVFDEVDTGVSGRVAQAIADKIYQIAQSSQVLCITHLPQVAAKSDAHYFIEKEVKNGRTETNVRILDSEERVQEIARMLSGEKITELALEHARELLE